ncbi:hypothetical protein FHS18_006561 [Paenibacillus phyllosphaerae]|uniref:Spore germination protein N-terminal domain-containing protein n=1 Tax=Paenibacillus phyllosphaerae TaxID=274593 RepID=A0A7W5B4U4_9BACL|nr:hypothetical protein [Paenibacillus phyllosphaerae]MBB3114440.1 hypothetical protein [Paenibacillus phyllosphaerae]
MKLRFLNLPIAIALLLTLSGCYDRLDMEEAAFTLVLGFDLDENGDLIIYSSIPAFNKNAKKKTQETIIHAPSPRAGRNKAAIRAIGVFQPRKLQVIVLSKHLVENKQEWFRYLDVFFRDGRNPLTSRVMVFDGQLRDLFKYQPKDKPILPLQLISLQESVNSSSLGVETTLQELQRTILDKGQTPALPQINLDSELQLSRTALLNHEGRYTASLTMNETMLLRMLQKKLRLTN